MRSLPDLQQAFAAALVRPAGDSAAALFRGPASLARARLAIYRGNWLANAAKALAAAFPVVRKIVGAEFFDAMAREYVRAMPSRSGDLNSYGSKLPEYLETFAHVQDLPYLPDVARMEWLAHRAYYAAQATPFDASWLACLPAERSARLRIVLAPACALLASQWPLGRIWAVHQDDYAGALEVDLRAGPDRILVHRPAWRAQVRSLAAGDWAFLEAAAGGAMLGEALAAAAAFDDEFEPQCALARWVDAGVIVRLD